MAIGLKGENLRLLTKVAECYLTTSGKAEVYTCTLHEVLASENIIMIEVLNI